MGVLLLDIGNSFVEAAIWTPQTWSVLDRFPTTLLAQTFPKLMAQAPSAVVAASVVPHADAYICRQLGEKTPIHFVNARNIPILKISLTSPEQVGADRLVNALAAYDRVQGSVLIIDCGTATTCCYVDATGTYQGGAIFPGLGLSAHALHDYTAKIPLIPITRRTPLFGKNTEEAVQSGIFHSHVFTLNGFIATCRAEDASVTVIGTGNGLEILKEALDLDTFDAHLILRGLGLVAQTLAQTAQQIKPD